MWVIRSCQCLTSLAMAPVTFRLPSNLVSDTCHILVTMLYRLTPVEFGVPLDTNWQVVLVIHSSVHRPIEIRQPWDVLTSDMLIRASHVDMYGLTCQHVILVMSARLFPTWWRSLGLTLFEMELVALALPPDF
ncbi:hypothetical protein AMTRI_Chr11g152650 [Amborella trichopoda]